MKRIPLILFAALIFAGCADYKKPIANVLEESVAAATNSIVTFQNKADLITAMKSGQGAEIFNKNATNYFSGAAYVAGLQKIDASKCPSDFRAAWTDYISAWQSRNAYSPPLVPIAGDLTQMMISNLRDFAADAKVVKEVHDAHDAGNSNLAAATSAVKDCAARYGVN